MLNTHLPTHFTLINIEHKHDSESDYDTAVDLSHWSMSEQTIIFQTPAGLRIEITERQESVTHSYLEPDFDHFDATGKTVYHGHADRDHDREKAYRWVRFEMPRQLPELSVNDFAEIKKASGDYSKIALSDALDRYLSITEWGDAHSSTFTNIDDADIQPFLNAAENLKFKKGKSVLIPISIEVVELIREAETKMLDICLANLVVKTHNNCEKAKFEIHEMTKAAMQEFFWRAD